MRAKFDRILVPIADELDRRRPAAPHHVRRLLRQRDVPRGGPRARHQADDRRQAAPCGHALKEQASALEEGKADILGLYMVTRLLEQGELTGATLEDHYVTFLASILRSIRFGAAEAHGRANAAQLSYLRGARRLHARLRDRPLPAWTSRRCASPWTRSAAGSSGSRATATTKASSDSWQSGARSPRPCSSDLARLGRKGIPVDVVFDQGKAVLGLGR